MKRTDILLLIAGNVIATIAATLILNFIYQNRNPVNPGTP